MIRLTAEQFAADENNRVHEHNIFPGVLLGMRLAVHKDTFVQLPLFVAEKTQALPPDYRAGIVGRLVTKKFTSLAINFEIRDGYFDTAFLARQLDDPTLEGEGYAVAITQQETGLPPKALDLLTARG